MGAGSWPGDRDAEWDGEGVGGHPCHRHGNCMLPSWGQHLWLGPEPPKAAPIPGPLASPISLGWGHVGLPSPDPALPAVSVSFHSPEWVPPVRGSWTRPGERVPGQWPLEGPGGHMVTTAGGGCHTAAPGCPCSLPPPPPRPTGQPGRRRGPPALPAAPPVSRLPAPGPGLGLGPHPECLRPQVCTRLLPGCLGRWCFSWNCWSPRLLEAAGAGGF